MSGKPSRLSPCPCGSGKRYKDCHGAISGDESGPAGFSRVVEKALVEQQAGRLEQAAALYRDALAFQPDNFDALHMLGVVHLQLKNARDALRLICRALDVEGWRQESALHNLGLALGQCSDPSTPTIGLGQLGAEYRRLHPETIDDSALLTRRDSRPEPLVSIIVPSFNHSMFIDAAIRSVFAQTYANWELLVIDDGSSDDSVKQLRQLIADGDPRCRLIVRENRGAAATLNQLISLSRGEWIHPLNSDDVLPPDRLQRCVEAVLTRRTEWLFGDVRCIDEAGHRLDEMQDARAFSFRTMQSAVAFEETVGLAFCAQNPAISTGNLFFSAELARRIGGFRELRYHHDWDFCLRALDEAEPIHLPDALYFYRFHGHNTIAEQSTQKQTEVDGMLAQYISTALSPNHRPRNRWAPAYVNWGDRLATLLLVRNLGKLLPATRLREMAIARLESSDR